MSPNPLEITNGVGPLRRKRYWADISGSPLTPETLMTRVHERFLELVKEETRVRA